MALKCCKFGGTSLADADQIHKVRDIVRRDADRRYVVPSAPGKRHQDDRKITDLLYLCHEHAKQDLSIDEVFGHIAERFLTITEELGLTLDLRPHLDQAEKAIMRIAKAGGGPDFAASRGEYLNGLILSEFLGYQFIDAAELIFFDRRGKLDEDRTYATIASRLQDVPRAVIPGFYGTAHDGGIKTFSRGGSDISGAVVARGVMANIYENWTDVSGLLMADPRVVDHPKTIENVTYRELRELAYMGATVLHDETIFPVRKAGIPVHIKNTNRPQDRGTVIFRGDVTQPNPTSTCPITGIAGRKDFTVINIEKALMNAEVGFGRRVLAALENSGVAYEHTPSGIDTMSVVVADSQLEGKLDKVLSAIRTECEPDSVDVFPDMALIATVGRGMARTPGMAAKLFTALAQAGVNIRMIDQGSSEINIIVGIETADFATAVNAIYHAFVA
jgi:aspartate kinase